MNSAEDLSGHETEVFQERSESGGMAPSFLINCTDTYSGILKYPEQMTWVKQGIFVAG